MTNKQVEEVVVKLTRIAHPEDLGEQTSKLEEAIRTTLTTLTDRDKEIMQEIEKLEKQLHLSGHHLRRQALSDIKALLTPIKEIEMNTQENKDWVEEKVEEFNGKYEPILGLKYFGTKNLLKDIENWLKQALQQAQEREKMIIRSERERIRKIVRKLESDRYGTLNVMDLLKELDNKE